MLRANRVCVDRGNRRVLDTVTCELRPGELLAVCGPNGAGKSTLLSVLAGDLRPNEGTVEIDHRPLQSLSPAELALRRAVLEQGARVSAPFRVDELVGIGASCAPISFLDLKPLTDRAMESAGVSHLSHKSIDRLSGGEAARVHLARVLAQLEAGRLASSGRYLLLDEPTASLDLSHQIGTMRAVKTVASDGGGVLCVLHDLNLAAAFADRVLMLRDGMIVSEGEPSEVLVEETLSAVFEVPFDVMHSPGTGLRIAPVYSAGLTVGR